MGMRHKGFTLIEVILFLAVTGIVMSVMLVGVSTGLNHQKYRDATNGLMSYMQDQYNLVSNVNNSRLDTDVCAGGGITRSSTAREGVGRSDCTIVGRLLRTSGGQFITSAKVVATEDVVNLPKNPSDADVKVLQDAKLTLDPNEEIYQPSWGTEVVSAGDHQPANFSILIVRMPTSGVIHTYVAPSGTVTPAELVRDYAQPSELKLCLNSKGLLGVSPAGTAIAANAANSSGITFVGEGDC